jgi:Tfp pilus assembly protein FimT
MNATNRKPRAQQGVALVTTVIVVAVLAVVAVAFMQSTTVDRLSARSVANYYRAKLAADAGAAVAESMLADLVGRYPDSVTVWQNIGGGGVGGTNNEATVLYARATGANTNGARPGQFGSQVSLVAQPLLSRAGADSFTVETNLVAISAVGSLLPFSADTMVNVNSTNSSRPDPLVGSRGGAAPVNAAQWIYLSQYGGPTNATNPVVAATMAAVEIPPAAAPPAAAPA